MNYRKIYNNLIEKAKYRVTEDYTESHHIVPKCLGGSDDLSNLVKLTPEEHYVAHQLLVKIYPNNPKLVKAAQMMIPNRPSNKLYGWLRRRFSEVMSESQLGYNNSQYGTIWINNGLESKKIKSSDLIPEGWYKGRVKKTKSDSVSKRQIKKEEDIRQYKEYYKIYCEHGWIKFLQMTNYKYSKQNFVTRCSKLLEDFIPQNGKRRGQ